MNRNPNYRWSNYPKSARPRKALRSGADGTVARTGYVAPFSSQSAGTSGTGRFRPPQLRDATRQPYVPKLHGSVVRRVHEQKPPPVCIHCGGPTTQAQRLSSHSHVEKVETRWVCAKPTCLGRLDAVIYLYPTGEYERRC